MITMRVKLNLPESRECSGPNPSSGPFGSSRQLRAQESGVLARRRKAINWDLLDASGTQPALHSPSDHPLPRSGLSTSNCSCVIALYHWPEQDRSEGKQRQEGSLAQKPQVAPKGEFKLPFRESAAVPIPMHDRGSCRGLQT